jgi:predicted alpha-1,6-mannanase (GH76 family)
VGWRVWAGKAHQLLVDRFWDGRRRLFRVHAGRRLLRRPHWHYWWQAHALDALADAAIREDGRSAVVRDQIAAFVPAIVRRNGGRIVNDYRDDMAWMALALLRAEVAARLDGGGLDGRGQDGAGLVRELWAEILAGWDRRHGGIIWRRGDTYTNAPTNAPAALLGARLYARDGDPADLRWAQTIDDWLHATLVDPATGLVWDGIHPQTDPAPSSELYTYNHGTVVGASLELHRLTGNVVHLGRAQRAAQATLDRFVRANDGILAAEGTQDGGLFKGILVRHLGEFVLAARGSAGQLRAAGSEGAGRQLAGQVAEMLRHNGVAIAPAAARAPVGPDWARPEVDAGDLSTHLSAVLLLETLARLEAAGVVLEPPAAPP